MTILQLFIGWKLKIFKWVFYLFVLLCAVVFLIIISLEFSAYHSDIEYQIYKNTGADVRLEGESRIGWHGGPSFKVDRLVYNGVVEGEKVELGLYQALWAVLRLHDVTRLDFTAESMRYRNIYLKAPRLSLKLDRQGTGQLLLTSAGGIIDLSPYGVIGDGILRILPQAGEKKIEFSCLYAPFYLEHTGGRAYNALLDAQDFTLIVNGKYSYISNGLDFIVQPVSKNGTAAGVPMAVTGSAGNPRLSINAGALLKGMRGLVPDATAGDSVMPEIKCRERL